MRIARLSLIGCPLLGLMALSGPSPAQDRPAEPDLEAGFRDPPASARPRLWWHWISGNVTREGIERDLEWMRAIGAGGVQQFVASIPSTPVVQERPAFMTPAWRENFRFTAQKADALGLEFATAASPGWSMTGGPWVPAEDGMKKLVWSETRIAGGQRFTGPLAPLPASAGPFPNMALSGGFEALGGKAEIPDAHGDTIVLAVPDTASASLDARLDAGGKAIDPASINDSAFRGGADVAVGEIGRPAHVLAAFDRPRTVRSATLFLRGAAIAGIGERVRASLEADDGRGGWRKITDILNTGVPTTVSFPAVTARRLRLALSKAPGPETLGYGSGDPGAVPSPFNLFARRPSTVKLARFVLSPEAKVNAFEAKAGFTPVPDYYALDAHAGTGEPGVKAASVIDVTDRVGPDGRLDWTPPRGRWRILRLGWSLTGATNHPGGEATGLEVDKYDGEAVRRYMSTYLGMFRETAGPGLVGRRGLRALLNDSNETGASNWTPRIVERFRRLRGYDPVPFLPALTGVVVGSRRESDAFLYDFRRTLADLLAGEHYGQVAASARAQGLIVYGQATENGRSLIGDDMAMRRHTDVPASAMWVYDRADGPKPAFIADVRGAASIAHVYGKTRVGTESLTTFNEPWTHGPGDLKPVMDIAFASGTNLALMHASTHQPVDDKVPGLSLGIFGQYLTRHDTWAGMARPWVDYIARTSFMLQQGRNVADIAYFAGEEAPLTMQYVDRQPDVPAGHAFDYLNADMVLGALRNEGGDVVTEGGARYRVLYLGGTSRFMTLPVLRRFAALVEGGATLIGTAPELTPSLADDPAAFAALVRRLWTGAPDGRVGKGRVIATAGLAAGLRTAAVRPDFDQGAASARLLFVHRRADDADIYFVNSRETRPVAVEASFRVAGKAPEIWRADTGTWTPASYRIEGGRTVVPLDLAPEDAQFVVFRKPAQDASRTVTPVAWTAAGEVTGGWTVRFQPGRGAPPSLRLERLQSLAERPEPDIRYFSGVATYESRFDLPRGVRPGAALRLDLGAVGDVAEVRVNGRPVGIAWKSPYRLDIGEAVKRGSNRIEVRVADLWRNRLIGDAQPGAAKITYTTAPTYLPKAALRPSGLMGPVTLWSGGEPTVAAARDGRR